MIKRARKFPVALCAAQLFAVPALMANNIQVTSVTLQSIDTTADTAVIQFNLSWENSWKVTTGPSNYDAAWVFAKYHTGDQIWKTATLDAADASHSVPAAAALDVGLNGTRGLGAFIYRAGTGTGNVSYPGIRLRWNYGADGVSDSALVTLDVHAIEMIYVPAGAFFMGDGVARAGTADTASIVDGTTPANAAPYQIANAGPTPVGSVAGSIFATGLAAGSYKAIPTTFPNGFSAFYMTKYEGSQGQWAAFLNTTSKLGLLSYQYYEVLNPLLPAPNPPRDFLSGRQVFLSPDFPAPTIIPGPIPPNPIPPAPTRTLVQARFPDRAFTASVIPAPVSIQITTTAGSLTATTPQTSAPLLTVGMPLSGNPNIPRGAVVQSFTVPAPPAAITIVIGNVSAAGITAGTAGTSLSLGPPGPEEAVLAYLDWSGLRPPTEFELEKSARGPVPPVPGEFAWGTVDIALQTYGAPAAGTLALSNDGLSNEGPAVNYNEAGGNAWVRQTLLTLPGGGPILGPARVGMFAKPAYNGPTPPRIQSGAGYYGFMDLTGNVSEIVAKWGFPLAAVATPTFTAEHGDGLLSAAGTHNVAGWALVPAGATFFGLRGGSFAEVALPISQRSLLNGGTMTNPGIRGARTAP